MFKKDKEPDERRNTLKRKCAIESIMLAVNSSIDNSNSYYIAKSLNNRAYKLSALLDAMSQGIQTITTGNDTLSAVNLLLKQAVSVTNQALQTARANGDTPLDLVDKDWLLTHGFDEDHIITGVDTITDINNKIAAAQNSSNKTVVILGEVNVNNGTIQMKDNVKLVGAAYAAQEAGSHNYQVADADKAVL